MKWNRVHCQSIVRSRGGFVGVTIFEASLIHFQLRHHCFPNTLFLFISLDFFFFSEHSFHSCHLLHIIHKCVYRYDNLWSNAEQMEGLWWKIQQQCESPVGYKEESISLLLISAPQCPHLLGTCLSPPWSCILCTARNLWRLQEPFKKSPKKNFF